MRHVLPTLALLALATGCGFPSASIDEPSICQTISDVPIPPSGGAQALSVPVQLDLRSALATLGVTSGHAHVTSVSLTPVDGVSDLSFLSSAKIELLGGGSDGGDESIFDYEGITSAGTLTMNGTGGDLFPAALDGPLSLQLTLQGALPDSSWSADAKICIDLQADIIAR